MNPFNVDLSEYNIRAPIISLELLYEKLPQTHGCEKCKEVNGDDEIWCCKLQSPSMYHVEFLLIWGEIKNWSKKRRSELIIRSIQAYLSNELQKGCVLWNNECSIYKKRPLCCRMYGIIPKESWDSRWNLLKEKYGERFNARPQCNLVSTVDGSVVTEQMETNWFKHTKKAEGRIGVSPLRIQLHDRDGGSYLTFHDHLLLTLFDASVLEMLTQVKLSNPTKEQIELMAKELEQKLAIAKVV